MRRSVQVLVVSGAVLGALAGVTACGADTRDDTSPERRSFPLAGHSLTVVSGDSTLEVVSDSGQKAGEVEVTRWFEGSTVFGSDPKVTWSMDGDKLKLHVDCDGVFANCAAKHRVEVPRGVAVTVESNDGSVRAEGFRDALGVRSHDGSVHVTDTTGPLSLRSNDGSVRAEVSSRRVNAQVHDGSLKLRFGQVPASVETRSQDGSTLIEVPGGAYRVRTDASDGSENVSVSRDNGSSHVITARSHDGGITVRPAN